MDKSKVTQKVDMFGRVSLVCDNHIIIVNGVPELQTSIALFKTKVTQVKALMQDVSTDNSGLAKGKHKTWEELAKSLNMLCAGLLAYANKQGNPELAMRARFSPSAFLQTRGSDAVERAKKLISLVEANLPSLADYNVTLAKVNAANSLATQLDTQNPKPATARTTGKAIRQQLFATVRDTTLLLTEEIDPLVRTLKNDEPLFVGEYFNARRLQHTGIRHKQPPVPPASALSAELAASVEEMNMGTVEAPVEDGVPA